LLADATKEVFDLQTQKKESQHKIDRLQDYDRQIEQHLKVQKLWYVDLSLPVVQLNSQQFVGTKILPGSIIAKMTSRSCKASTGRWRCALRAWKRLRRDLKRRPGMDPPKALHVRQVKRFLGDTVDKFKPWRRV
jgi:hypothetical protein